MKRFINGDNVQFNWLRNQIQEALMTFSDVELPASCIPNRCRVGFEFTSSKGYTFYIDKNILYTGNHAGFSALLSSGEMSFQTYEAMIAFIRGLGSLFGTPQRQNNPLPSFPQLGQAPYNQILPPTPADKYLALTYPVTSPRGNRMNFEFKYEKHGSVWRAFIVSSPNYGSRATSFLDTHRHQASDGRFYVCWEPEPQRLDDITKVSKMWAKATAKYIDTGVFC